jgi:acyl dehydratase
MDVHLTVRDVMQSPVDTISADEPVTVGATRLGEAPTRTLVVVDGDEPVGVLTASNLIDCVAAEHDVSTVPVREVMSSPLVTVGPDDPIEVAVERLREHDVARLVVKNGVDGWGVVTTDHLSYYIPQIVREATEHPTRGERLRVRSDTAYEEDDWTFDYRGTDEATVSVGDVARFTKPISAEDVAEFAHATGDTNRVHLDDAYAEGTRFERRIAHGVLSMGVISAALARLPGLVIYLSQELSFTAPVDIGASVTAECTVAEDLGDGRYRLDTVVDADGERVVEGDAVVLVDEMPPLPEDR